MSKTETRIKTIEILEAQLIRGTKPRKNGWSFKDYNQEEVLVDTETGKPHSIKLNQKDIERINKEVSVLENKIIITN